MWSSWTMMIKLCLIQYEMNAYCMLGWTPHARGTSCWKWGWTKWPQNIDCFVLTHSGWWLAMSYKRWGQSTEHKPKPQSGSRPPQQRPFPNNEMGIIFSTQVTTKKGLLKLSWGVAKNTVWHLQWNPLFVLQGLQQGHIPSVASSGNECPFVLISRISLLHYTRLPPTCVLYSTILSDITKPLALHKLERISLCNITPNIMKSGSFVCTRYHVKVTYGSSAHSWRWFHVC